MSARGDDRTEADRALDRRRGGGGIRPHRPVYNPATGEQSGEVQFASVEEIDRAVLAAKAASTTWRTWSLSKRAELFFRIYQLLDEHRGTSRGSSPPSTARSSPTRSARCSAGSRWSSTSAASPSS